jgi:TrmH family RNA methyltransferase
MLEPPGHALLMKSISSRQNAVVRTVRELARDPDPAGGRLLLDGAHLVREALTSGVPFELALISASRLGADGEERTLALELERNGLEVIAASDDVFSALSPVKSPSGIVAIVSRQPFSVSEVCRAGDRFILAAVDVQDPGNVGALLRAAEAGGVSGAFVCGRSASPFSWKALRGSMGSTLRLPVAGGITTEEALAGIKKAGARTVAAVARGGGSPDAIDWSGPIGLLLGGEGPGLSDRIVESCDQQVTIPMASPVESLSVAVAGAILIYAARRQRLPRSVRADGPVATGVRLEPGARP